MSIESRIVTAPKSFKLKGRGTCILGSAGKAACYIENTAKELPLAKEGESRIAEKISSLLDSAPDGKKVVIRMSIDKAPAGVSHAEQGYSINVKAKEIELVGFGEPGLYYACVTLCQLLKLIGNELSLPCLEILDYPDIEKRGHFVESRYATNLMELSDWKQVVDDMVEKKQNMLTVSLYGCWSIQYDGLVSEYVYYNFKKYPKLRTPVVTRYYSPSEGKWIDKTTYPPMYEQNFFGELVAYGKQKGVEVVPLINTYGHNSHIPAQYPEVSAKFPDGRPTGNGYCTSEDATYELLFNLFDDIIDNCLKPYGITSFDIGMDEVGDDEVGVNANDPFGHYPVFCHCKKCESSGKTPIEKFIAHAVKMALYLKKRGMKSVCIYNDMLYRAVRPAEQNFLPMFYKALRDNDLIDTVVMNWWGYWDVRERLDNYFRIDVLKEVPTRLMIKPMNGYYHWNMLRQSVRNSFMMAEYAHDANAYAYISYSSWDKSYDRTNSLQATLSWSFGASGDIDECTKAYAARLFPNQAEKAAEAINLLDVMNEEGPVEETNSDHMSVARKKVQNLSTRTLVERYLAYYFYSYLRSGTEYPQNFPGRAMKTLLDDRANCEKVMKKVLRDAKRAEKLFTELSCDPTGDMTAAARYAVDSARFVCLVEDYFALLRIYDLSLKVTAEGIEEMKTLAKGRVAARKVFMKRYESIKEHYLLSSHMRNMSIYLQFMSDLSAYLETATPENFKINFEDFGAIASEQFKKLR